MSVRVARWHCEAATRCRVLSKLALSGPFADLRLAPVTPEAAGSSPVHPATSLALLGCCRVAGLRRGDAPDARQRARVPSTPPIPSQSISYIHQLGVWPPACQPAVRSRFRSTLGLNSLSCAGSVRCAGRCRSQWPKVCHSGTPRARGFGWRGRPSRSVMTFDGSRCQGRYLDAGASFSDQS